MPPSAIGRTNTRLSIAKVVLLTGEDLMAKVLLVEDDQALAYSIAKMFAQEGHVMEVSHDGRDGLERVMVGSYEMIILDISLPELDGLEICRQYRQSGGATPIIFLTGKSYVADKELGLDLGADDYVTKPFSIKELLARVRAILRRPKVCQNEIFQFGRLSLNPRIMELTKDGVKVELFAVDFALLQFLMRHANEIFDSDTLIERVWHTDRIASDSAVRTAIKRIRQKIDTEGEDSFIETVSRVGYRFRTPPS